MRLYYVRHGLTDWNAAGRLQGQLDVPLNQIGREQAARCGGILRDLFERDGWPDPTSEYVSSPLARARTTMETMRGVLGLPAAGYRLEPRLAEISFGEWEGLTYREITQREPNVTARREADKWRFSPPGGESYEQLAQRVGAWLVTVEHEAVVCAHGGTGRALVALLGVAPPDEAVHHSIDQGVVYLFERGRVTRYE
jgi:probable phosphoglycerate mutase